MLIILALALTAAVLFAQLARVAHHEGDRRSAAGLGGAAVGAALSLGLLLWRWPSG